MAKRSKKLTRSARVTPIVVTSAPRNTDVSIVGNQETGCSLFPTEQGETIAISSVKDVRPGAQCTWYYFGPSGARVNIQISRIPNTGGHNHPGGPAGTVSPTSFVLGPNYPQNVPVVFTAPIAAGSIQQVGYFSVGNPSSTVVTNRVCIPGFAQLTAGVGLTLTGASATHPLNHFGIPQLVAKIRQLAASFHAKFGKNLFINDMSLPDGGLYDFNNSWATPHATHREGRTVDINSTSMSPEERNFFRQTANGLGFSVTLETKPEHWHLSI